MTAPAAGWTVELLREYVDRELAILAKVQDQNRANDLRAVEVALTANKEKLEDMNEIRGSLADQSNTMMPRAEAETALNGMAARIFAEIGPLREKLDALGKPNWGLITSMFSILVVMVTGVWLIIGLKIDASEAPLALSLEQLKISNASRDRQINDNSTVTARLVQESSVMGNTISSIVATQASRGPELARASQAISVFSAGAATSQAERTILTQRVTQIEQNQANNRAERVATAATVRAKLVEVETQFKAMSDVLNLFKDDVQQREAIFFQQLNPGLHYPSRNFRPDLFNNKSD